LFQITRNTLRKKKEGKKGCRNRRIIEERGELTSNRVTPKEKRGGEALICGGRKPVRGEKMERAGEIRFRGKWLKKGQKKRRQGAAGPNKERVRTSSA